jgi:hypothetical protein
MPSSFKELINQLERQKIAIDRAIAALRDVGEEDFEQTEEPTPTNNVHGNTGVTKKKPGRKAAVKRTLSPEARKRISDAVKKRWAAAKKATGKKSA